MPKDVDLEQENNRDLSAPLPVVVRREHEKELLAWEAPSRPFKRRSKDFFVKIIAIAILFGIIVIAVDGVLPALVIASVVFFIYVLSTVEPELIKYQITNKGVKVHDRLVPWSMMGAFWFTTRFDSELLVIETAMLPGRIELVVQTEQKPTMKKILSEYLLFIEEPPYFMDKAAAWVSKKLPSL